METPQPAGSELPPAPKGFGERDERGRDLLGFITQQCPHCHAALYLADEPDTKPVCLNACTLPTYLYRKLMAHQPLHED